MVSAWSYVWASYGAAGFILLIFGGYVLRRLSLLFVADIQEPKDPKGMRRREHVKTGRTKIEKAQKSDDT